MAMRNVIRTFGPTERYEFDYGPCTAAKGWAQVDTACDASYHGIWANPFRLWTFTYIEGDRILVKCDTEDDFIEEIKAIQQFHGEDFIGIDPGFNEKLKEQFIKFGFREIIH
jgi:hypothetical protein